MSHAFLGREVESRTARKVRGRLPSSCRAPTTLSAPKHDHHDMAGTPNLHAGLDHTTSASRLTAITTSAGDDKSAKPEKHKSHRHRHHSSRHDKEHRHSSSRRHAKEVVQSAIQLQPPTSFGDLLKQARGSKDTSPSHSRKGSIAPKADGNRQEHENEPAGTGITIPPRRPLRPEDVDRERKRVEARERYCIAPSPTSRHAAEGY